MDFSELKIYLISFTCALVWRLKFADRPPNRYKKPKLAPPPPNKSPTREFLTHMHREVTITSEGL